ncbi:MAG TPA: glycosyltransferase family 2 protein, partial [Candidatus Peribacteraceae bacterium]|nr:glycosyltransferase family 2 protein [Candidatus Peribacteraceae bacterium]
IRLGLEHAAGAYTVIQDADLEYDPQEIKLLLDAAKLNPHCAIFGSRFLKKNPHIYWRFLLGNKVLTAWLNLLFGSRVTDSYTCYKLLPTHIFKQLHLTSRGFELEAEIASRCLKTGIDVIEVPISYRPRSVEEGKKINWTDAVKGLLMMWKVRVQ